MWCHLNMESVLLVMFGVICVYTSLETDASHNWGEIAEARHYPTLSNPKDNTELNVKQLDKPTKGHETADRSAQGKFCTSNKNGDGICTQESSCKRWTSLQSIDGVCDRDGGEVCCHDCQGSNSCTVCKDEIPSSCSLPSSWNDCSKLRRNNFCNYPWSMHDCGDTPGLVRDNCRASCGNCNGDIVRRPGYTVNKNKKCTQYLSLPVSFEEAEEDCNRYNCSFIMNKDCRKYEKYHVCNTPATLMYAVDDYSCVYEKEDLGDWTSLCTSCDVDSTPTEKPKDEDSIIGDMTLNACKKLCIQDDKCTAIDYGKGSRSKDCFLNFGGKRSHSQADNFDAYILKRCLVAGVRGDGTAKGDCAANNVCNANGICTACPWARFTGHVNINDDNMITLEGKEITYNKTPEECQLICDNNVNEGCQSFTYCSNDVGSERGECYFYNKKLIGSEPQEPWTPQDPCHTNYRNCGSTHSCSGRGTQNGTICCDRSPHFYARRTEIEAQCRGDPSCVAFDYESENRYGHFCTTLNQCSTPNRAYEFCVLLEDDPKIDGGWSEYGDWTECTASCGAGTHSRYRTCTAPAPSGGGAECEGDDTITESCELAACEVE